MTDTLMPAADLARLVVQSLEDLKAQDVRVLDVTALTSIMDVMVIASGTSNRHVKALSESVLEAAKAAGVRPIGVEGDATSDWILVDLGDVVVHVMLPRTRSFYNLEKLWSVGEAPASLAGDEAG
jgi:ribosome-associated protein